MVKKSLSSMAVRRVVNEAHGVRGAYFHKAYQLDYDTLVLRFSIKRSLLSEDGRAGALRDVLLSSKLSDTPSDPGQAAGPADATANYVRFDLYFKMGGYLFITPSVDHEMPKDPSPFAMKLRKALDNRVLADISQVAMDRLVVLRFSPGPEGGEGRELYLELFGDGNAILVDGGTIEAPFTSRSWASRTVKKGERFVLPPSGVDPSTLTKGMLMDLSRDSKEDLVHFLIRKCNLPPLYSEELCFRASLDKRTGLASLGEDGLEKVLSKMLEMLKEVEGGTGGSVHFRDGEAQFVEPITITSLFEGERPAIIEGDGSEAVPGGPAVVRLPSINGAVERWMFGAPDDEGQAEPTSGELELGKLKRQLENQEKALAERREEAERFRRLADALYLDYQRVDGILSTFDGEKFLHDRDAFPEVMDHTVPEKSGGGTIQISVPTGKGSESVTLHTDMDLNRNADVLYDRSKEAKRKADGIVRAIEDTKEKIEEAEAGMEEMAEEAAKAGLRTFWFEEHRWCLSSEGILLIGGRDARSNERIVKKYMRETDLYAHADVSGASSVVIRVDKGQEPTDATREEGCHLSLLHSKAWNAKIGSASAYWVLPEQVSRTPQSGEFLAKGSFVIRGKKNIFDKLPLEGAVGLTYIEGVPKVMFGPERAVKAQCRGTLYMVRPGRTRKTEIAKVLAKELGGELDQIVSVLPAGDMDLVRSEGARAD